VRISPFMLRAAGMAALNPREGNMYKKTVKPWYRSTALIVGVAVTSIGGMVVVIAKHLAALMP
jgi:hypothetical protein